MQQESSRKKRWGLAEKWGRKRKETFENENSDKNFFTTIFALNSQEIAYNKNIERDKKENSKNVYRGFVVKHIKRYASTVAAEPNSVGNGMISPW